MANVSDIIETFLLEMLQSADTLSISRNDLAAYFSVAPSQINYVLSTRFTPEKGYTVESRRGGGGSVTVVRVREAPDELLKTIMRRSVSEGFRESAAFAVADRLCELGYLTADEARLLKAATADRALILPFGSGKDALRVSIIKSVAAELLKRGRFAGGAARGGADGDETGFRSQKTVDDPAEEE
ncbi:MAG: CtsR family transcriptional regulator [Clostridiales bacterium]|nr:CtsR family transcriptional regulator [Clostridiales bacterium]